MPESLLVTGRIGDAVHAVTCTALTCTGSAPVVAWIASLTGDYDYVWLKDNLGELARLFATYEVLLYEDETTAAPMPVIERAEPRSMVAQGPDVELHVFGLGFTPRSQIVFNGGLEVTTFVGPTELTTTVTGATATTPGDYPVAVDTAQPGGGRTGELLFAIVEPEGG